MAFITSFARSKLSSIFKHPLVKNTFTQRSNLSNFAKLNGPSTCNSPTLLFSRPHKRVHYSSSKLGFTHLRNYHNGHGSYYNTFRDYVISKGKWGYWVWYHRVNVAIVGSCVVVSICLGNWETVPYSQRKHYVPWSDVYDNWLAKDEFDDTKAKYKNQILDRKHPTSQRIYKISKDVLAALRKDLELDEGSMALSYGSVSKPTKKKMKSKKNKSWVEKRHERKVGKHHLDGMHWEVVVVDSPTVNAFCLPNGKIVVFTGLLKICKTDDEIATVIGHEVGHVVARHVSERLMMILWLLTILLVVLQFIPSYPEGVDKLFKEVQKLLIEYPLSRRREAEADQIGLMLMASAGYDPRQAPDVYKKLDTADIDFFSTHPSGKKRAEKLSKDVTMQHALSVYNKFISQLKEDAETNSITSEAKQDTETKSSTQFDFH